MTLSKLEIVQFRNLQSVSISLHPCVNVFYGANGSGKTSILEAIFFSVEAAHLGALKRAD